jgi:hypothetical protein
MALLVLTMAILGVLTAVVARPDPAEKRDAIPVRADEERRRPPRR